MFCALNGQHYALTCFHVGCATDKNRLKNAAFNKVEDVQKMRNSLPAYESYAKKQQYYFTQGNTENDNEPILFGDDGTNCTACTKRRNVETKRPKRNETTETKRPKRNSRKYKLQEKWKTLKYEIYGKFY
jgi:hypothetical protein